MLNTLDVHELIRVGVTVETPPGMVQVAGIVRRLSVCGLWLLTTTTIRGLSCLASRLSVDSMCLLVCFCAKQIVGFSFLVLANQWAGLPLSSCLFLPSQCLFSVLASSSKSLNQTEPNQMKVQTVPYFIFTWVLQELQLFDLSHGLYRTRDFVLAQHWQFVQDVPHLSPPVTPLRDNAVQDGWRSDLSRSTAAAPNNI